MIDHRYLIDFERDWNCLLDPELALVLLLRTGLPSRREPHNHTLSDTSNCFQNAGANQAVDISHNGGGDKLYAGSFLSFPEMCIFPFLGSPSSQVEYIPHYLTVLP